MEMDSHRYPYASLFKKLIPDLSHPDPEGWATGSCPYCGDPETFRVNLKSGRWTCVPPPPATTLPKPTRTAGRINHES